MSKQLVVCDAGPLIALAKINHLDLLKTFFENIVLPQSVVNECTIRLDLPGAKEIAHKIDHNFFIIHETSYFIEPALSFLDEGERNAIQLALDLEAVLFIDEKLGRSIAQKFKIPIIGTAGILLAGYKKGIIKDLELVLNLLKNSGYRLSKRLIQKILIETK